ncbi:MAG: enolase C-terminal domain-like protein, partial [Bryobacteraceae bacterium]
MRVANCKPVVLTAPYIRPGANAQEAANSVRSCVWLRIDTDAGLTGWGEAYSGCYAPTVTVAALDRLCTGLRGCDISDPMSLMREVRFRNRYWAMRGIGAQATSAIEAALWDAAAQERNMPLWRLLGDGTARPVLAYASMGENRRMPDEIRAEAARFVEQGYRAYKLRCGGTRFEHSAGRFQLDVERVAAAREGLGPNPLLFVDVHVPQRPVPWAREEAEAFLHAIHPFRVDFLEEPAMTYDVTAYRELQSLG